MKTSNVYISALLVCQLLISNLWAKELISGYEFLSDHAKEMQNDDFQNPGYIFIEEGLDIFNQSSDSGQSCATCHGTGGKNFVAKQIAQYPKYSPILNKPQTLSNQIQRCWNVKLDNFPLLHEDRKLLALETFVRNKAIGEPVNVDISGKMKPYYEAGKKIYQTRYGQMDMNCALCHDIYDGKMLRGQKLTQGHTNGFPEFRLESQKMINLPQRLRECYRSLRAETFEQDSEEFRNLEIYLNARGNGLKIETPAIRY